MTDKSLNDRLPTAKNALLADDTEIKAIDLWNKADDRSLINIVPPALESAFLAAANANPELFAGDERDLYKKLRDSARTPSPTDNRLRLAFWMEYDRAQANFKNIRIDNVFGGICTRSYFYGAYLNNPHKVAWLLMPPTSYVVKMEETLDFGLDQLRDILEMECGPRDVKLMELKAKIVAMVDQRVRGAVTQRIENRNMNLNVNTSDKQVASLAITGTMDQLDLRLKQLEAMERKALNLPQNDTKAPAVVEAEVVPSE